MGTHSGMAVTEANGEHHCWEHTTDGSELVGAVREVGRMSPVKLAALAYSGKFGGGELEEGNDREHEQAYFLHVNWQGRYIGIEMATFWEVVDGKTPDKFVEEWRALIAGLPEGWTMRFEYDCPHQMDADKERYADERASSEATAGSDATAS